MYKALSPWAVGIQPASIDEAIICARHGGFGGVEISVREIADLIEKDGLDEVLVKFSDAGLKPAGFGLPVEFRNDEEAWREGLAALPRLAAAAAAIGCTRTSTWIMPCSNELNFDANRRFHIARFRPIAEILGEHGINLGLEFIGPKTLRDSRRFPFIYTMDSMVDMGRQIGPNVGLLLDCWHWHTSGGTRAEIEALIPDIVVYVHVNDAPKGVGMDDYIDNQRGLPGETGVIDIAGFLQSLRLIGYDGPIVPEPFKDLSALPSDLDRAEVIGAAMERIFGR